MQTEEWCGFTVACSDNEHHAYMVLKNILERGLINVQRKLRTVDALRFPLYHYIYLDVPDKLFSVYMKVDCSVYVGIYDCKTNKVVRHCDYSDLEMITGEDLDSLFRRLENVINRGYDIVRNERLKHAWETCIMRESDITYGRELDYDI